METFEMDCEVNYWPYFMKPEEATSLYHHILESCDLSRRLVTTFNSKGKEVNYKLNRGTCIFLEEELKNSEIVPNIWGKDAPKYGWSALMLALKEKIESETGKKYNICLCNYYATGNRAIGFHSDNEEYGSVSNIASISLGEEREFVFRKKTLIKEDRISVFLKHGSLLLMGEGCQENYEHSIPANKECKNPRINLTFRLFSDDRYDKIY